jgi:hypothetical protein
MIIGAVTLMTIVGTKEDKPIRKVALKDFWKRLKESDPRLHKKFSHSLPGILISLLPGYNLKSFASRKIYGGYQKKLKLG